MWNRSTRIGTLTSRLFPSSCFELVGRCVYCLGGAQSHCRHAMRIPRRSNFSLVPQKILVYAGDYDNCYSTFIGVTLKLYNAREFPFAWIGLPILLLIILFLWMLLASHCVCSVHAEETHAATALSSRLRCLLPHLAAPSPFAVAVTFIVITIVSQRMEFL